jgi:hypothetical protein
MHAEKCAALGTSPVDFFFGDEQLDTIRLNTFQICNGACRVFLFVALIEMLYIGAWKFVAGKAVRTVSFCAMSAIFYFAANA